MVLFFNVIIFLIVLINTQILKDYLYQKRIKKDPNYIESLLTTAKNEINYIYISEINEIILLENYNKLIPIQENISINNEYYFYLNLVFNKISKNNQNKEINKIQLIIFINDEICFNDKINIENELDYKTVKCIYYSKLIYNGCNMKIKLNDDEYVLQCYNKNINLDVVPQYKIYDCFFIQNIFSFYCNIEKINDNIIKNDTVKIYINNINVEFIIDKDNNVNMYLFKIQSSKQILLKKNDIISIIFEKDNYIIFKKEFKILQNEIINEISEKKTDNNEKDYNYQKYFMNPTYSYRSNVFYVNPEYSHNNTNINNTIKNNFNYSIKQKYFYKSLIKYQYNRYLNNNTTENSSIQTDNENICNELNYNLTNKVKQNLLQSEFFEYYFTRKNNTIKIYYYNIEIGDIIYNLLLKCNYILEIKSNYLIITSYDINFQKNFITLFIDNINYKYINTQNEIKIIMHNNIKTIELIKTKIYYINPKIKLYGIEYDNDYIYFNFDNIPLSKKNFNFNKILCLFDNEGYNYFEYDKIKKKYHCKIDNFNTNISFYSLFTNNDRNELFFIKTIYINTTNTEKSTSRFNYNKYLYDSLFYNKSIFEDEFIFNYSLSVNYPDYFNKLTYKTEIINEVYLFKMLYNLSDNEKYYLQNSSNVDLYYMDKPNVIFNLSQIRYNNYDFYCLINNKFIIHSFIDKIKDDEYYVMKCILNFPLIKNYIYPNKIKVCIYNKIDVLIKENYFLYDCKYASFLDDNFAIKKDEIKIDNKIISFKEIKLKSIYKALINNDYEVYCLIEDEKKEVFKSSLIFNEASNECKCYFDNFTSEDEFKLYFFAKNKNTDKVITKFINIINLKTNLKFNYSTKYNNYIIINSPLEQEILLVAIENTKFNNNTNNYCLLKNYYFSYLLPVIFYNETQITCKIKYTIDINTLYANYFDIYFVTDYDHNKNNFTLYYKAANSPINCFKLPKLQEKNIYLNYYDDYFYINIDYYKNYYYLNEKNYYVLILNKTLFYDCFYYNEKLIKCNNSKHPYDIIYNKNNNESIITNIYKDLFITEINYLYKNIKLNIIWLMPFSPININLFNNYYLSNLDNNLNILYRSPFTKIFYEYNPNIKLFFYDNKDIIIYKNISRTNKTNEDIFKFELNIDDLIEGNNLLIEFYYFIYYEDLNETMRNNLPINLLNNILIINLKKLELENISPIKKYYNKTQVLLKLKISNFVYEYNNKKIPYIFFLENIDYPNFYYLTFKYKCELISDNNIYSCLVLFENDVLFYTGNYCIGITLLNKENNKKYFCNETNNIQIFLSKRKNSTNEDSSIFIYYNIELITPSVFYTNTKINIYFTPILIKENFVKNIFPIIDNSINITNCKIVDENNLKCFISDLLLNKTGYHIISFQNENKETISNSISFILIKKPVIVEYVPQLTFPTKENSYENNFIKINFDQFFLDDMSYLLNKINCRFKIFELSNEIKMPIKKDTKGLLLDDNNIVCFLENNYFVGDFIHIQIKFNDNQNNFIDFYSNFYFNSKNFITYENYEPKFLLFDVNNYNNEYYKNEIIIIYTNLTNYLDNIFNISCLITNNIDEDYIILEAINYNITQITCPIPFEIIKLTLFCNNTIKDDEELKYNSITINIIINNILQRTTNNQIVVKILNNTIIENIYPKEFSITGMIDINISGSYFYTFINYYCNFNFNETSFITKSVFVSENLITCKSPNISSLSFDTEYITGHLLITTDINYLINKNNFEIKSFKEIKLNYIESNFTFLHNSYGITIYGENFINVLSLKMKLTYQKYSILIKPIFINSKTLFFYSPTSIDFISVINPKSKIPLEIDLSVSNNNYEYTSGLILYMYPYPIMFSISPTFIYFSDELLTIKGRNFYEHLTHCLFVDESNNETHLTQISKFNETNIECSVPFFITNYSKYIRIKLVSKQKNIFEVFDLNKIYLIMKKLIEIEQINIIPNKILLNTTQKIIVKLIDDNYIKREIIESSEFKIKICDQNATDIKYINYYSFSFMSTVEAKVKTCDLILIYENKQINIPKNKIYFIEYSIEDLLITPLLSDYKGGTLITIYNKNKFNNLIDYKCEFINKDDNTTNSIIVASILDDHHITCMTKQHAIGNYYIAVLIDDLISTFPTYLINFEFYGQIRIRKIDPLLISENYNCLLKIEADNVIYSKDLIFKIGNDYNLTYNEINNLTYNNFSFYLPQYLEKGNYSFSISNNNQNFYVFYDEIQIIDNDEIFIKNIYPNYIPFNTEGTAFIYGENFNKFIIYKNDFKIKIGNDYIGELKYINDTCLSFDYPKTLTNNDDQLKLIPVIIFSECVYKIFYPEIVLYKKERNFIISPLYIESYYYDNRYLIIKDAGYNENSLKTLLCKFNETKIENAYYINQDTFICKIPLLDRNEYDIEFSSNGIDFVHPLNDTYKKIKIIKNLEILKISELMISNEYIGDIEIYGNNFIDHKYKCKYTKIKSMTNNIIITDGIYKSPNIIKCNSPNIFLYDEYNKTDYESIYAVQIGLDYYDKDIGFTEEHLRIFFNYNYLYIYIYQYPPNGYFIDIENKYIIKKCTEGYACNRNQLTFKNVYKYPCLHGYYMPFENRHLCLNCPKNNFDCSNSDITKPLTNYSNKCKPGFICKNHGINIFPCQNGYICNNDLYSIKPIPCPVGYFCFEGTNYNISINQNYSTPQKCTMGHICPLKSTNPLGIGECITGHYCPDSVSGPIPCPPRSFCPERGNVKPLLCEEGYYNDKYGMEKCFLCPIGYICPYKGLYKPIPCPPGYYCDKKGLRFPYKFCEAGSICEKNIKFGFPEKICFYSRECDSSYYEVDNPLEGSEYLEKYLEYDYTFHTKLCCYNGKKFKKVFEQLDNLLLDSLNTDVLYSSYYKDLDFNYKFYTSLLQKYSLSNYYQSFLKSDLTGYKIAIDFVENKTIDYSLSLLNIKIPFHKELLSSIIDDMLNDQHTFSPKRCPRKYYCLEGVSTISIDGSWDYTPQLCTENYYCSGGDKYPSGTGSCPRDYYCPKGSDLPSYASDGTINIGNVTIETKCYPGTFLTSETGSTDCIDCPGGYECSKKGVYWPVICAEGYYNTVYMTCVACPKGTFSYEKGVKDSSLCISCPPGTLCQSVGIHNSSDIKLCDEGYVCDIASGIYQRESCPSGFYCDEGTTPDMKYKYPCPEGYICAEGTGKSSMYGTKCPSDYYCPSGSKYSYENGTYNYLPKCPYGTSSLGEGGLRSMIECKMTRDYNIFNVADSGRLRLLNLKNDNYNYNVRKLDEIDTDSFDEKNTDNEDLYSYYTTAKNLDLIELTINKYKTSSDDEDYINQQRKPILSFSPVNLTSSASPYKSIVINTDDISSYLKFYKHYYKIEKNNYALITFDLRHIEVNINDNFFIYGIDWDISFEKVLSIENSITQKLDMPLTFLSQKNNKSNVHEFNLYTYEDMILTFNINIYNGMYITYLSYFRDMCTIITVSPKRAELYTNKFFGIVITKEDLDKLAFPVNIPLKNTSLESINLDLKDKVYKQALSYNLLDDKTNLTVQNYIQEGMNSFVQSENYWGTSEILGLTHIPFISNCRGYGRYIHLWSLLEHNSKCNLIKENDTIYIKDFSFGLNAVGDNCNISLECIYDESIDMVTNEKYWYDVASGFTMFKITKNPIELDELYNHINDLELIDVSVVNNLENGEIPKTVTLDINYFQVSTKLKKIIDASITFSDPISKSALRDYNGTVNYTFNVNYNPYSHTKLMVVFALSSKFYIFLFVFVDIITTIMVTIYFLYHRYMSRSEKIKIKILTFIPLILPSVIIGFVLSVIPIFVETLICHFFLCGKIFFKQVYMFSKKSDDDNEYLSIFDFISYLGDNTDDLSAIRKGRFGTAILTLGILMTYYHTLLVVPDVPIKAKRSFDNNRWDFINWKRAHVYYVDFLLSIINIYYTFLSFSNLWSVNIWYFIYSYKIIGILAENYFEEIFQEQLLIAGFGCIFNLMQNMLTFGATDLIDFLKSTFIEQGSLLIEKVYVEAFTNYVKEHWSEYKKYMKEFLRKLLKYDVDIEFEQKEDEAEDEDAEADDSLILENNNENENNEIGEDEKQDKNSLSNTKSTKKSHAINELHSDEDSNEKNDKNSNVIEIEEYLDRYKGFASDLLSYFYNIFFYFVLWITYDENYIIANYEISTDNFIFFYYFSIINICFAILNDIIMHNLLEQHSDIQMHDFLDYFNYRYYIRSQSWGLDQNEVNLEIEPSSVKMFKLGFSSQYYYLKTFYVSGLLFIDIGAVTMMLNSINPFYDLATPFVILFVYVTLKLVMMGSSALIHRYEIWDIEKKPEEKNENENENKEKSKKENLIKPLAINDTDWNRIQYISEQENIFKENLRSERLVLETTKKQFIAHNKKWLRDNIQNIITPRTLLRNKTRLIEILSKKFNEEEIKEEGKIIPFKFYSSIKKGKHKGSSESNQSENESEINKSQINSTKKIEFMKKARNESFIKEILKIWRNKANLNQKLKKMIKITLIKMKKNKCEICGNNDSLSVIYVGNLINVFIKFLKEKHQSLDDYKKEDFLEYFKEHEENNVKTKCSRCN